MAKTGIKPKPAALAVFHGKKEDRKEPEKPPIEHRSEPLDPPRKLTVAQRKVWDRFIEPAWWLTQNDAMLAYMLCVNYAEYIRAPKEAHTAFQSEMRRQMGELGLTSSEAARRGIDLTSGKKDPGNKYYD